MFAGLLQYYYVFTKFGPEIIHQFVSIISSKNFTFNFNFNSPIMEISFIYFVIMYLCIFDFSLVTLRHVKLQIVGTLPKGCAS